MIYEDVFIATQPDIEQEAYETERGKPMPNIIHGTIQNKIGFLLQKGYGDRFIFPDELNLDTKPNSKAPDLCIYPKRKLDLRAVTPKEATVPITTIEIQSPSQSIDELQKKVWDIYFPFGVKTAWIVIPALKAVQILTADDGQFFFNSGMLTDPETKIQLSIEQIFEDLL